MLAESRFDTERRSMGLEIELNLTDAGGDPAMGNDKVLALMADPDFQTELAQFNIEINIPPQLLDGRRSSASSRPTSAPASTTPTTWPTRPAPTS